MTVVFVIAAVVMAYALGVITARNGNDEILQDIAETHKSDCRKSWDNGYEAGFNEGLRGDQAA